MQAVLIVDRFDVSFPISVARFRKATDATYSVRYSRNARRPRDFTSSAHRSRESPPTASQYISTAPRKTSLRQVLEVDLLRLLETLAHRAHLSGERFDGLHQDLVFQILHDLLTIGDRVEIIQSRVIERLEVVVLPVGRNGVDDLIQIQIAKKGRRFNVSVFVPSSALRIVCCGKSW